MRTLRFYTPQTLSSDSLIQLDDEAAHHVFTVLRLKEGHALSVFNGAGGEYEATISATSKKAVTLQLGKFHNSNKQSSLNTHLAIGLSKGDRFETALQKATELGVTSISPLLTERTEIKLSSERLTKATQRWQRILISACEQSGRNILPVLCTPQTLSSWIEHNHSPCKLILHPFEHPVSEPSRSLSSITQPESVCLLIGPEGGFSDAEVQQAIQHQFQSLMLGPRILRTETAPLAALSIVQYLWGDLA